MKKISIILICILMLNAACVSSVWADDAQITISDATCEVLIGKTENGKTPAINLKDAYQNGHSVTIITQNGYADFTVYSPVEAVYKLSVCYGSTTNLYFSVFVNDMVNAQKNQEKLLSTDNLDSNTWAGVGPASSVKLNQGVNTIRFQATSSPVDFKFTGFKLESPGTDKKVEFGTGTYTITGASGTTATRNKATVPAGGKMSIFVNAFNGGNYKLFANNVNTASTSLKYSVGDAKANMATVAGEEGFAELGIVTLNEGQNVINIENAGTSSIEINNIMLEHTTKKIYAVNEMDGATKEFTFRREIDGVGVTDIGVTNSSCVFNKSSVTLNQKDNFIEYTVIAENAGNYNLNLSCNAQNLDVRIAVLVNDSDQIEYVTMTGGELSRTYKNIGTIRLLEGENRIIFKNVTPAANGLVNSSMDKFKLICVDESTAPIEFATNKWTITNSNVQSAFRTEVNVTDSKSFEYDVVNAGDEAEYKLSVYYSSSNSTPITLSTSVNGLAQIAQTVLSKTATADTLEWAEAGVVSLASGINTLKLDFSNGDLTKIKKIKLSPNKDSSVTDVNKTISETASMDIIYTAEKGGWYGVLANISNAQNFTAKASLGAQIAKKSVTADGDAYIGKLYLSEGENTITLGAISGSATVNTVTIGAMQEDITSSTYTYAINPSTVGYTTNYEENDSALSGADFIDLRVGGENSNPDTSFTVGIYTNKALNYTLSAYLGVIYEAMGINVTVNGEKQLQAISVPTENDLVERTLGIITLKRGINELTFDADGKDAQTAQDGIAQHLSVAGIKLVAESSFKDGEFSKALTSGNASGESFVGDAGYADDYATLTKNSYIEYDVYTSAERIVNVRLNANAQADASFAILVNGEQVTGGTIKAGNEYASTFGDASFDLASGISTIKYIQTNGTANIKQISVQNADVDDIGVAAFEFQTESGYTLPKAITTGYDVYAVAKLKKLGSMVDDNVMLVLSQYNGNILESCDAVKVNFAEVEPYVTGEYKAKITLKENITEVKAFLMKSNNLSPMAENIAYREIEIIPQETLLGLYNEVVSYKPANEITDSNGVLYGNYDYNTSNGLVKAIFYDSEVPTAGAQTKVFAYMGVPNKDANGNAVNEANPVPAVVLLHGGECKVDKTWVAKWLEKGYAAIAIDLYGWGPDKLYHPYKGIEPWGGTMWKGVETAGMYQNTLNIIRAHNLIMSLDGVDETKTALAGLSMGGITTANMLGFDTRFDVAVPIYGTTVNDVNEYHTPAWDPLIQASKADIPVMLIAGANDTNFNIERHTTTMDVLKDGYLSVYQHLPHSDIAREFEQVYNFIINHFNGENPYIKISNEGIEDNVFTADFAVPQGTTVNKVVTYYTTAKTLIKGDNNWQAIEGTLSPDGTLTQVVPDGATNVYASVHFTYDGNTFNDNYSDDLILTSKLVKIK